MSTASRVVIVFAKKPEPGQVKTRLIGSITAVQAAEVHRWCLRLTLDTLSDLGDADLVVAISPDDADFTGFLSQKAQIQPQGSGDLGARLNRSIENAFKTGWQRVLVVGSDCPTMSAQDVRRAFDLLDRDDVVIGPAVDGGYYLLGLRQPSCRLFERIDWSTSRVFSQTLARSEEAGLSVALLPERRDVDEFDDIIALEREISDDEPHLRAFKAFLQTLIENGEDRE